MRDPREHEARQRVLAGEGQGGVAQVVDRQVRTAGRFARWAVVVRRIAHAYVIGAVAGEQQTRWLGGGVLEQVLLEHRQERRRDVDRSHTAPVVGGGDRAAGVRSGALRAGDDVLVEPARQAHRQLKVLGSRPGSL